MPNKAVFVDRDHTLIEDPGYLSDPSAVRLLPGVELAIKSLHQAGYKVVVVSNQSGVSRGLVSIETLEKIHAELRRQLAERGAHLDGIYYCPYHPEGTVEQFAVESDLRKPQPGMLLAAAEDLDIDLSASWMVGDSPRDIEAGQRAGCRTVRLRVAGDRTVDTAGQDEDVQADFTVRNLVDAARVILRNERAPAAAESGPVVSAAGGKAPSPPALPDAAAARESEPPPPSRMSDSQVRMEILRHLRQYVRSQHDEDFSYTKLAAGIVQVLVFLTLLITLWQAFTERIEVALLWAMVSMTLQVMALSFFMMHRSR